MGFVVGFTELDGIEKLRKEVDTFFKEKSCSQYFYNEFIKEDDEANIKNTTANLSGSKVLQHNFWKEGDIPEKLD